MPVCERIGNFLSIKQFWCRMPHALSPESTIRPVLSGSIGSRQKLTTVKPNEWADVETLDVATGKRKRPWLQGKLVENQLPRVAPKIPLATSL